MTKLQIMVYCVLTRNQRWQTTTGGKCKLDLMGKRKQSSLKLQAYLTQTVHK